MLNLYLFIGVLILEIWVVFVSRVVLFLVSINSDYNFTVIYGLDLILSRYGLDVILAN